MRVGLVMAKAACEISTIIQFLRFRTKLVFFYYKIENYLYKMGRIRQRRKETCGVVRKRLSNLKWFLAKKKKTRIKYELVQLIENRQMGGWQTIERAHLLCLHAASCKRSTNRFNHLTSVLFVTKLYVSHKMRNTMVQFVKASAYKLTHGRPTFYE